MPHFKAVDKYGYILAISYNVELHEIVGSVNGPNLAPHTYYPQGEFYVSEINFKNNTLRSRNTALDKAIFINFVVPREITNNDIKTDNNYDSLSVKGPGSNSFVLNNSMNNRLSISSNAFNVKSKTNIDYNLPKVLKGTVSPTTGSCRLGDIVVNTSRTLTSGRPFKWICTSDGVATNMKGTPNTTYRDGQIVYNGNYPYKAVASGSNGTTQPTHNNGVLSYGSILKQFISTHASSEVVSQTHVTYKVLTAHLYIKVRLL
ncbi:hypothetical protein [Staphylococcus phage vB_SauH_DELF3]|nr:hypothetical protein [Staphylococcus phage vB_SauH_DELF3]